MLTTTFLAVFVGGLAIIVTTVIFKSIRTARQKRDATDHIDRGKNLEAIKHLAEIVLADPEDLVSLFNLASLQIETDLPFEGMQNVKKLLERNLAASGVNHVAVVLLAAKGEFALGNRKEGYKYLMIARGIDGTSLEVNVSLAAYNYEDGNYPDAFGYAFRALKLEPDNINANFYSGMAAFQQGNFETAIGSLEKVVALQPTNFIALYSLGRIYGKVGNVAKAGGAFGAALRHAANDDQRAQVYLQWGHNLNKALNQDKAVECFNHTVRLASSAEVKKEALREILTIHEAARKVDKILDVLKAYTALDPLDEIFKAKARYYSELNSNEKLKKYEMSSLPDFVNYCCEIARQIVRVDSIVTAEINKDGSVDVLANRSTKTQNSNYQFRFVRTKGEIGEITLRDLYAKMRGNSAEKAFIAANTVFTESAVKFAQTRVVTLVNREALLKYMDKVSG
jgi:tetratricopeptide (TPR) repeat protein